MNILEFGEQIKQIALDLGFDLVGITDAANPCSFPLYHSWIDAGNQGEMAYLSSERGLSHRADLNKVLPNAQSVIVLAKKVNPSLLDKKLDCFQGRIASYAWNMDYHDTFITLLKELLKCIENLANKSVNAKYYTDTGPILERELASRAGLGWIGKNSMLINPDIGSFFLLSEILLDMPLNPDPPFVDDRCGSCSKCIEACPTNCILPNRTIDSRSCLSYLTIELKGEIPVELRPKVDEWVFGCDLCQQVCPWNQRFAKPTNDASFALRDEVLHPDLLSELELTPENFSLKFKGRPIKRTKRRGYFRNIITALGNTKRIELIPILASLLNNDQEILIRQHSAWALGQIGGEEALKQLQKALITERDSQVIIEINLAIGEIN